MRWPWAGKAGGLVSAADSLRQKHSPRTHTHPVGQSAREWATSRAQGIAPLRRHRLGKAACRGALHLGTWKLSWRRMAHPSRPSTAQHASKLSVSPPRRLPVVQPVVLPIRSQGPRRRLRSLPAVPQRCGVVSSQPAAGDVDQLPSWQVQPAARIPICQARGPFHPTQGRRPRARSRGWLAIPAPPETPQAPRGPGAAARQGFDMGNYRRTANAQRPGGAARHHAGPHVDLHSWRRAAASALGAKAGGYDARQTSSRAGIGSWRTHRMLAASWRGERLSLRRRQTLASCARAPPSVDYHSANP